MECIVADKFSGVREHIHQVTEQCQKTSMTVTHSPTHSLAHSHLLTHPPTHSPTHRIRHYSVQSQEMVLSYQLNKLSTAVTEQTTGIQLPRTRSRNERERERDNLCHCTGSAADVCKVAMIEVSHQLAQTSPHSRLVADDS